MKKITVAVGPTSTNTLQWAAEAAHVTRLPLDVVDVLEPSFAEHSPKVLDDMLAARRADISKMIGDFDIDELDVLPAGGEDPMAAFARHLTDGPAGLAVVGASDAHGIGSGDPVPYLLHHTDSPVAMVTDEHPPLSDGIVVLGVDGTGANATAAAWAEEFAARTGSTIHAVFAYSPFDDTFTLPEGWHRHSNEVRAELDAITRVPVELFLTAGHKPAETLAEHAEVHRASVIVCGTRGRGSLEGMVIGKVPKELIGHARTPLVIVPH